MGVATSILSMWSKRQRGPNCELETAVCLPIASVPTNEPEKWQKAELRLSSHALVHVL